MLPALLCLAVVLAQATLLESRQPPNPRLSWTQKLEVVVRGVKTALCVGGETFVGRAPRLRGSEASDATPGGLPCGQQKQGLPGSHCRDTPPPAPALRITCPQGPAQRWGPGAQQAGPVPRPRERWNSSPSSGGGLWPPPLAEKVEPCPGRALSEPGSQLCHGQGRQRFKGASPVCRGFSGKAVL
ncbi:hypothetical protein H8959_016915 [Pygathrix nigripes]